MLRICRPTLLACTHFQKTLELRRKSFSELRNTKCGAKTIRRHRLVCLRKDLQKVSVSRPKRERPRTETCLSVFNSDGSKNVVRITNAIQRWNVAFICVGFLFISRGAVVRAMSANLTGK